MNNTPIRGRFAPSPSGRLHVGNMLSSLLAWLDVRALDGEILFRLEDLDPDRSSYDKALYMADDLQWLGLDWDLGWNGDKDSLYAQSCRTELYQTVFRDFEERGLVYPCFCSRAQRLAASAPHPGELQDLGCGCMHLSESDRRQLISEKKHSYRIRVDNCNIQFADDHYGPQSFSMYAGKDDFIVRRADGVFAYQLAVSYDDAVMGITRVVRANDLLDSSPKQIWLIREMGYEPPTYCHAPLLEVDGGRKMSKRNGDLCMLELRKTHTPKELCGKLAYLAGLLPAPESVSPKDLIGIFSWDKVPTENILLPQGLF
ncbi:MAG: tRNA glutamyl-Q(34) synthetase GluQRS [Oscillospiraceae bacterium]|nr:tRNA glutamyl-Q(34) synthetase GluQRS [Oscillospiraceae bacterium]